MNSKEQTNKNDKLLKKINELEKKVEELEKKKTPKFTKVKTFITKHKFFFIALPILFVFFVSWEGYSLHSYRKSLYAATVAQTKGNFQEAEKNFLDVQKATRRSLVLFVARDKNVKQMIERNKELENIYEKQLAYIHEKDTETKEESEEELQEETEPISAPTPAPEPKAKPTPKPAPAPKAEPAPKPAPTPAPAPEPAPEPTPEPTESYEYHNYYPIILSLQDNKGNIIKSSQSNGYSGLWKYSYNITNTILKVGDKIYLEVKAKDPENRKLFYNFTSSSQWFNELHGIENGRYKWLTTNNITHTINQKDLETAGETMRIVGRIKSEKGNLRHPGGEDDDSIFLDYTLSPK